MPKKALAALAYPLKGGAGTTLAVFSLGFSLAVFAGLLGLPLLLILVSWTAKYAFVLLERTALGHAQAPVLDIDMMNPVSEMRPWFAVLIVGLGFGGWRVISEHAGQVPAVLFATAFAFAFPASLSLLALERALGPAMDPRRVLGLIGALGPRYLSLPAILSACLAGMLGIAEYEFPVLLASVLRVYLLFLSFHVAGLFLFINRQRLGIEAERSPERAAEKESRDIELRRQRAMDEAYALHRGRGKQAALASLEAHLGRSDAGSEDRKWFFRALLQWDDVSTALGFARESLSRLLDEGDPGGALDLCAECLSHHPDFRPAREQETLALAEAASGAGRKTLALTLLRDFAQRYPDSLSLQSALLLAAGLALDHENDQALARCLLDEIETRFPAAVHDPRVARMKAMLP